MRRSGYGFEIKFSRIWGSSRRAPERDRQPVLGRHLAGFIPACAGAGFSARCCARAVWFIPACAGAGPPRSSLQAPRGVHPGVRRSGPVTSVAGSTCTGSSRRAPEREAKVERNRAAEGFIPACAGAGSSEEEEHGEPWVHPGVRRSGKSIRQSRPERRGSSRRAPERVEAVSALDPASGFIPACAGAGSRKGAA